MPHPTAHTAPREARDAELSAAVRELCGVEPSGPVTVSPVAGERGRLAGAVLTFPRNALYVQLDRFGLACYHLRGRRWYRVDHRERFQAAAAVLYRKLAELLPELRRAIGEHGHSI